MSLRQKMRMRSRANKKNGKDDPEAEEVEVNRKAKGHVAE